LPAQQARSAKSRVVLLASLAHKRGSVVLADLHFSKGRKYAPWVAYGQSKVANILDARELADQLAAAGAGHVTALSLHPGIIKTNLARHMGLNPVLNAVFEVAICVRPAPPHYHHHHHQQD